MTTGRGPVGALAALPVGRLQKAEVTSGCTGAGADPPLAAGGRAQAGGWVSAAAQQGLRQESLAHLRLPIFEPHEMEKSFGACRLCINSVRGGHGKQ